MARDNTPSWGLLSRQILEALDIPAVYRSLGVKFPGTPPNAGWLACYPIDRPDEHASAAICVDKDAPPLGRYVDKGGVCASWSLWDFAVRWGEASNWLAARAKFAQQAGIELPRGTEPKRPEDSVDWDEFFLTSITQDYCNAKEPGLIKPQALAEIGCRSGRYPKNSPRPQSIIGLPLFGIWGVIADPVGWVIIDAAGGMIRKYDGKDLEGKAKYIPIKTMTLKGSSGGVLNRWAVAHLEEAEHVWRVEGVSDLFVLHSAIPPELKKQHVAISGGFGAGDSMSPDLYRLLRGKIVHLIGDRDMAGDAGVGKWKASLEGKAKEIIIVSNEFPYPLTDCKGKDLRDLGHEWIRGWL
jgi:hypothetical protein